MLTDIECDSCGTRLGAFKSLGAEPLNREDCPTCGGTEFSFPE